MRIFSLRARVLSNRRVATGIWRLALEAPPLARAIRPGQFLNLVTGPDLDPLLPRPFSVFRVQGGTLEFLIQVVGRGTQCLSRLKPGDSIDCFGPLGQGFRIPPHRERRRHLMVAGGIGVAPFYALGKALGKRRKALLYGASTPAHLACLGDFQEACGRVETITDRKGYVTALLEKELGETGPVQLYACGPTPMLKAVWEIALDRNLPCQLSLETPMACGFGICKGCSFPRRAPEAGYTLTCKEGPVYEAGAIRFP